MYRYFMNFCNLDYMQLSWKGLFKLLASIRQCFHLKNKSRASSAAREVKCIALREKKRYYVWDMASTRRILLQRTQLLTFYVLNHFLI